MTPQLEVRNLKKYFKTVPGCCMRWTVFTSRWTRAKPSGLSASPAAGRQHRAHIASPNRAD